MKKKLIIIFSVFIILIFICAYLYVDYTRTIENVTNYSINGKWAYNLKNTGNEIIFTLYQKVEPQVKNLTIYHIENNIVKDISYEQHYTNKLNALYESTKKIDNAKNVSVKNNIVYYNPIATAEIGITKETLLETLSGFDKIYIKIE